MRNIASILVTFDQSASFFSNQIAIWPIFSLQLRENCESFITDFESSCSRDLKIKWSVFCIVWNKIIVHIIWKIWFWNLIFHNDSIRNSSHERLGYLLEEFLILWFIVANVPQMFLAILARFNNKYDFGRLIHVKYF